MPEYDPPNANTIRKKYATDQLMNQFLKTEGGGVGRSAEFRRGYVWNFEWCSSDPEKAQPEKVKRVQALMAGGISFEEAFAHVASDRPPSTCCGCVCGFCEHQGGDNIHSPACAETPRVGT